MKPVTFAFLVMTDGKESYMRVARGMLKKNGAINVNAKTTVDVTTVRVTAGLAGIHAKLAREYATPEYPAVPWGE